MDPELQLTLMSLRHAKCVEDVFGALKSADKVRDAKRLFRKFAMVCHEDRYQRPEDKAAADEAFTLLNQWWEEAETKIKTGTYGDRNRVKNTPAASTVVTIQSKKRVYAVSSTLATGDIADVFSAHYSDADGTKDIVLKVARSPQDHDLMQAEANALKILNGVSDLEFRVPRLLETFAVQDAAKVRRVASVFEKQDGIVDLEKVMKMAPIDPRDVAWMGNRLWVTLGLAHTAGVIHGAIVPSNVMICPKNHGLVLVDWCYSILNPSTEKIKSIAPKYRDMYPHEVLTKGRPGTYTDIYMAAKLLSGLLSDRSGVFPATVPDSMKRFLASCLISAPHRRPTDAFEMWDEWKALLQSAYGKPKWRDFHVPELVA